MINPDTTYLPEENKTQLYLYIFLCLILVLNLFSCNKNEAIEENPTIVITGTIDNYVDSLKPYISVNRVAANQEKVLPQIDEKGNFRFEFEASIPLDLWFVNDPYFIMVAKPGDSIQVEITPYDTVKFIGDRSNENSIIYDFFHRWQEQRATYADVSAAMTSLDQLAFLDKMDSIKVDFNQFTSAYLATNEVIDPYLVSWINEFTNSYYYNNLCYYVFGNQKKDVDKIQDKLLTRLPLRKDILYNAANTTSFVNYFNFTNIGKELLQKSGSINDTTQMQAIFAFDRDALMRQLLISENIMRRLTKLDVTLYEKYKSEIDSLVTEPVIDNSIKEAYASAVKSLEEAEKIDVPLIINDTFNAVDLLDSVVSANKGQIVYIDIWATWCAPCISEFINKENFEEALTDLPVTNVYICAQSKNTKAWKAMVKKYNLNGVNIYLNEGQYKEFDAKFDIEGFPTYLIFNKSGELVEKGFSWRPSNPKTLSRIKELL